MFCIPANWELNGDAKPFYDLLNAAVMFHCQLESAARQLTTVWDDMEGWWRSSADASARVRISFQLSLLSIISGETYCIRSERGVKDR